jgi:AcrR family transcriptional regulator
MARKKEISKKRIFNAAVRLAMHEGIDKLTARNIARALNCSTQPIYLEFKSMGDLRAQVVDKLIEKFDSKMLEKSYIDEPLIDMDLSYIYFAQEDPDLFKSMFIEDKFCAEFVNKIWFQLGVDKLEDQVDTSHFDGERKQEILTLNWITVNGIATLALNQILTLNQDQIVSLLHAQLYDAILNNRLSGEENNDMFAAGQDASLISKLS